MDEYLNKQIELHSAGAIVQHKSPFADLELYQSQTRIDTDFIKKWVSDKNYQDINFSIEYFDEQMEVLNRIKNA